MCKDVDFVFRVQELLDEGNSLTKVAVKLNVHHSKVCRLLSRGLVEMYTAFDEEDTKHLYQNFEWLWEEDKLEEVTNFAFYDMKVNVTDVLGENFYSVGRYVRENYGNIFSYLRSKNLYILAEFINKECTSCNKPKPINKFRILNGTIFGLDSHCNGCNSQRMKQYCKDNPDFMKMHLNKRRARKVVLPDTLTVDNYRDTLEHFGYSCALTERKEDLSIEHALPISIGHGGTTFENCYPLSRSLNSSKNDSNIFEWFEANRQRFELSQQKFDKLIAWLASANAMTVEEYKDYVHWCHANPRTIDELRDAQ